MSRRKKPSRRRKILKAWSKQMINTGTAPLWKKLLYNSSGSTNVRQELSRTTDWRKANPVWVEPNWDPEKGLKITKVEQRDEWKRLSVDITLRFTTYLVFRKCEYYYEKQMKVTKQVFRSYTYLSLEDAEYAWNNGKILWRKLNGP